MPRGVKKSVPGADTKQFVKELEAKLQDIHDACKKMYERGFVDGATAERKRVAGVLMGGGDVVSKSQAAAVKQKSEAVQKKPRKNPWDNYTPEQKAERLAKLKEARERRFGPKPATPAEPVESAEPVASVS